MRIERLHRRLVGRTWELTLDLLDAQGLAEARTIMRLMSCFAPAPFPIDLLDVDILSSTALFPPMQLADRLDRALEALVSLSLLDVTEVLNSYNGDDEAACLVAHPLVLEANAHWLRDAETRERVAIWRAAVQLLEARDDLIPELPRHRSWWRLLVPHVQTVVSRVPADDAEVLAQALQLGLSVFTHLWFDEKVDEASDLATLLKERSTELNSDHPVRLSIRHRHALAHLDREEAAAEYSDVLAAQLRELGRDHPETLITRHDMATVMEEKGALAEAEAEYRAVLEDRRRVLGPSSPYTLVTHSALAELIRKRGHTEQANREYGNIAHVIANEVDDPSFLPLHNRHQLAHALDDQGRFEEAERDYRAILKELEEDGATNTILYRGLKKCLSENLSKQNKHADALREYEELISVIPPGEPEGVDLLDMYHRHGDLLRYAGEYERAVVEIKKGLNLRVVNADENDSVVLQERHCLSHALESLGQYEEAEAELSSVVAAYSALLGDEAEKTREAMYCLGLLMQSIGRWSEADRLYEVVLAAESAALGADHSDTLVTMFKLTQVRLSSGAITAEVAIETFRKLLSLQTSLCESGSKRIAELRDEIFRLRSKKRRPNA
ncbi:tetratricopeptide repeat protein [Microbispora rosea]|uniref:tetratricopeptide repeat protein n=1 Tax=Microbispora rosea TaxID=58117 RepID=UPI00378F467C